MLYVILALVLIGLAAFAVKIKSRKGPRYIYFPNGVPEGVRISLSEAVNRYGKPRKK